MWVSMNPFINLAEARAPDGALMSLHSKGEHYFLRVNGQSLMATNAPESERVLAEVACAGLSTRKSVRVLIGGLGFGFTLRRTLELVGPDALVTVGELTALHQSGKCCGQVGLSFSISNGSPRTWKNLVPLRSLVKRICASLPPHCTAPPTSLPGLPSSRNPDFRGSVSITALTVCPGVTNEPSGRNFF